MPPAGVTPLPFKKANTRRGTRFSELRKPAEPIDGPIVYPAATSDFLPMRNLRPVAAGLVGEPAGQPARGVPPLLCEVIGGNRGVKFLLTIFG